MYVPQIIQVILSVERPPPVGAVTWWQACGKIRSWRVSCPPTVNLLVTPQVKRRNHDGTAQQVPCPPIVVAYNQYVGGVDRGEQLRQYYWVRCKTRKFYRYIFWFLFDSCVVNAFILHKKFVPVNNMSAKEATVRAFRVRLAESLIGQYCSRQR